MTSPAPPAAQPGSRALLLSAALVSLVHLTFAARYGFFRDELYFIACGQRPSWGYVDQPPLLPLLAAGWDALVGGSLLGFRCLPALLSGLLSFVTGRLALRFGASAFAACFAALAVAAAPVFLFAGHTLTVNTLEPMLWTALVLQVLALPHVRGSALGWLIGLGLLNKYTLLFWVLSLLVGLALTPSRPLLLSPAVRRAAALALLLVLPNVLWQAQHGWPFLELLESGRASKNAPFDLTELLAQVILQSHPLLLPLWLLGLPWLWRRQRAIAWAALTCSALLIALQAKSYYLAPLFPTLFAAGAAAATHFLAGAAWRRIAASAALLLAACATAPLAVPVLPVSALLAYQRALGLAPQRLENKEYGELPQHFADQHGWPEMGAAAAAAFALLTPGEQARAAVLTDNYGEAGAIQRFGGVPAISGHNQYWLWGPEPADGSVLIVFGSQRATLERFFAEVEQVGTGPNSPLLMPYQRARPIWLVRKPLRPLSELWRHVRHIE